MPQPSEAEYRQVSNISRTLVGNWIVDHSDVVGASPVGAAPTTSSFHYDDVTMGVIASLTIVYSTVYSSADQSKHHSSA